MILRKCHTAVAADPVINPPPKNKRTLKLLLAAEWILVPSSSKASEQVGRSNGGQEAQLALGVRKAAGQTARNDSRVGLANLWITAEPESAPNCEICSTRLRAAAVRSPHQTNGSDANLAGSTRRFCLISSGKGRAIVLVHNTFELWNLDLRLKTDGKISYQVHRKRTKAITFLLVFSLALYL